MSVKPQCFQSQQLIQLVPYNTPNTIQYTKYYKLRVDFKLDIFSGIQEPVHCMGFYKGELVSATTANRIGVHTSLDRLVYPNQF